MYVQLLRRKDIIEQGERIRHEAGDWVDVGRQTAMAWIGDGDAVAIGAAQAELMAGCGIVASGDASAAAQRLGCLVTNDSPPCIPYDRTLCWDMKRKARTELFPVGFQLLDRWQVAVPLRSYDRLASQVGTTTERELTKAVVRDTRCLVYEPGVLFLRDCQTSHDLLDEWSRQDQGDRAHAFLRALYIVKPLVLALPCSWAGLNGR